MCQGVYVCYMHMCESVVVVNYRFYRYRECVCVGMWMYKYSVCVFV